MALPAQPAKPEVGHDEAGGPHGDSAAVVPHAACSCWLGAWRLWLGSLPWLGSRGTVVLAGLPGKADEPRAIDADAEQQAVEAQPAERAGGGQAGDAAPAEPRATALEAAPPRSTGLDYRKFELLALQEERESRGRAVLLSGRRGWNAAINGMYTEDGCLNGRPRLRHRSGARWLKFNDAGQWMVSKYSDGRPCGEALAADAPESPRQIRGPWYVCSEQLQWESDASVAVTREGCLCCGRSTDKPLRCGRCRAVSYCSQACQRADWAYHRRTCSAPTAPAAEEKEGQAPGQAGAAVTVCTTDAEGTSGTAVARAAAEAVADVTAAVGAARTADASSKAGVAGSRALRAALACAPAAAAPSAGGRTSAWNAAGTWEDRNMLGWMRERLQLELGSPGGASCPCGEGGCVEAVRVQEVEGIASIGLNRGERRRLFDVSFEFVFRASWLHDHGSMSTEGVVQVVDSWRFAGALPDVHPPASSSSWHPTRQ